MGSGFREGRMGLKLFSRFVLALRVFRTASLLDIPFFNEGKGDYVCLLCWCVRCLDSVQLPFVSLYVLLLPSFSREIFLSI